MRTDDAWSPTPSPPTHEPGLWDLILDAILAVVERVLLALATILAMWQSIWLHQQANRKLMDPAEVLPWLTKLSLDWTQGEWVLVWLAGIGTFFLGLGLLALTLRPFRLMDRPQSL